MSRVPQKVLNNFGLDQPVYYIIFQLLSILGLNYEIIDDFKPRQLFFHLLIVSDQLESNGQEILFEDNPWLFAQLEEQIDVLLKIFLIKSYSILYIKVASILFD